MTADTWPQLDLEVRWSPSRSAWVIKPRDRRTHKVFAVKRTKSETVALAARLARRFATGSVTGACEVYIYRRFGQRSRWVDRRTYGRDPKPPRGSEG